MDEMYTQTLMNMVNSKYMDIVAYLVHVGYGWVQWQVHMTRNNETKTYYIRTK